MKCKENYCPPVEFLYLAADVIEKPGLVKAMVGNRSLAIQSELLMPGATGEQAHIYKTNAPDHRAFEDASIFTKPEKNFPEADDVLTLAGVDPNDEARLMLAQGSHDDQSFHGRRAKKNSSRKLTELCIFARVIGQLPRSGICKVDNKAYDLLEEALQIHLRCLIMKIFNRALQRNDSKPSVLGRSNTHSEPKQRIRQINVDAEVQKRERVDIERKALLRVGESILSKRRTRAGDDSHLKEKVARIRQEEEERIRATIANDAARSALGDAKYLKWFVSSGGKEADRESQRKPSRELTCKQNDEKDSEIRFLKRSMDGRGARANWTVSLKDCRDVIGDEYKRFEAA